MNVHVPGGVIYVFGSSSVDAGTEPRLKSSGGLSGQFPHAAHTKILGRARPYNPYQIARGFPDRWQAYIRASFRSIGHVARTFDVSEKTARNWWNGKTGARGAHVAIAVNEHPDTAPTMLFAAE